jgi:hypothetical protein
MLVLLGTDILCDGVGEPLLFLRLPIVGQREFDIGGKRLLPIGEPQEEGCSVSSRFLTGCSKGIDPKLTKNN